MNEGNKRKDWTVVDQEAAKITTGDVMKALKWNKSGGVRL